MQDKLNEVIDALDDLGIKGFIVSECKRVGGPNQTAKVYRGVEYNVCYLYKSKIEIAVHDDQLQATIDVIHNICRTGGSTDGILYVFEMPYCVNFGTGKTGDDAI